MSRAKPFTAQDIEARGGFRADPRRLTVEQVSAHPDIAALALSQDDLETEAAHLNASLFPDRLAFSGDAPVVTAKQVAKMPKMAALAPDQLVALTGEVNTALAHHRVRQMAAEQETAARIIASLSEMRNATRGLLECSQSMPAALRFEVRIDEGALIALLTRIEDRIGHYEARRRNGRGGDTKSYLRQRLADELLAVLSARCRAVATDPPRARRWIADIQRAAGLVTPDESKNPERLLGRRIRASKKAARRAENSTK